MNITAVWLKRLGKDAVVEIEVDGKWIEVIRERFDGAFSHIVESSGMVRAQICAQGNPDYGTVSPELALVDSTVEKAQNDLFTKDA